MAFPVSIRQLTFPLSSNPAYSKSPIAVLPTEIREHIFSFLPLSSLLPLRKSCRLFYHESTRPYDKALKLFKQHFIFAKNNMRYRWENRPEGSTIVKKSLAYKLFLENTFVCEYDPVREELEKLLTLAQKADYISTFRIDYISLLPEYIEMLSSFASQRNPFKEVQVCSLTPAFIDSSSVNKLTSLMPRIKSLTCKFSFSQQQESLQFSHLKELEEVELTPQYLSENTQKALFENLRESSAHLQSIRFSEPLSGKEIYQKLEEFPCLKKLSLFYARELPSAFLSLHLASLREFGLNHKLRPFEEGEEIPLHRGLVVFLSSHPHLEKLTLDDMPLKDELMDFLPIGLEFLSIKNSALSKVGIEKLKTRCPKLKKLQASFLNCRVSDIKTVFQGTSVELAGFGLDRPYSFDTPSLECFESLED